MTLLAITQITAVFSLPSFRLQTIFKNAPQSVEHGLIILQIIQCVNKQLDVLSFGFVVGLTKNTSVHQQLIEESLRYNDILQVNVYDKYRNLSIKAAGRFNWINLRCSPVDFVLKVDDDVYVNIHNLATILHSFSPIERSIYGHKTGGSQPSRTEGIYHQLKFAQVNLIMPRFYIINRLR